MHPVAPLRVKIGHVQDIRGKLVKYSRPEIKHLKSTRSSEQNGV